MVKQKTRLVFGALLLALTALPVCAQLDTGIFSGRVTDASGAVVPSAAVSVVETSTNFTTETKSNNEGLYRLPTLRPGPYRLTVKASGFKSYVREGLELHVGENQEINAVLEVGGTTESVVVTAEAAQLQTESSAGGAELEGAYLQKLPLYQRYAEAAFFLIPNVDGQGITYG
jgi:hypothetical protein